MIKAAIVGYGNIGRAALEALSAAQDFSVCGVVRRSGSGEGCPELNGLPVVQNIEELPEKPEVALICTPTRSVLETAEGILKMGICTVDSFDIHTQIPQMHAALGQLARQGGSVAILSAGWDPGSDSVVRTLLEACAPKGLTFTNFGPGMSMGHSVAIRAIEGVADALSVTIPAGAGLHKRMCYVQLKKGADPAKIERQILEDDYFAHDETHIQFVPDVSAVRDMGHGVHIERKGVSGSTHSQRFSFDMQINNPALTAQIMVSAARAALRQTPGCYTLIELPPIDLLPGERAEHIARLV
ncbi:MAG: diaminopimelate dehydrogenase [Provencibacterium sp.]|jgi:diaminopimelate dehydrogenase|nr:diaminopimelate dehydrogenase [Provencibacterium sp.]